MFDIEFDENAFESLVISEAHKELVLAITESQAENKESFDDVIEGKGKGLIILLGGPPGVGKTLTAESVAERMRVPLYTMGALDFGVVAAHAESALARILKMVTGWNTVLLLDEADVFLEQRTTHDLERNKLVSSKYALTIKRKVACYLNEMVCSQYSVFLRTLEYYTGTLFLTTNRAFAIDEAFKSRIHIRLTYSALDIPSRRRVWANFIASSGRRSDFSEEDLDSLAEKDLNGRQIKNVLKTAVLLAARRREILRKQHVEMLLEIDPQ